MMAEQRALEAGQGPEDQTEHSYCEDQDTMAGQDTQQGYHQGY